MAALVMWAVQRQVAATNANTIALAVLTSKMEDSVKKIERVESKMEGQEKIRQDLNMLYSRVKSLESSAKGI